MRMYAAYQLGAQQVRAHLGKPPDSPRTLAPVRHMVHFPKGTTPKAGQVLMKDGKPVVLLADHHAHALGEVMLGLKITGQELWQSAERSVNPVTKMEQAMGFSPAEPIWVVEEVLEPELVGNQVATRRVFYTGSEVKLNDRIGSLTVRGLVKSLGIYRVEVST